MSNYKELKVWQKAHANTLIIYVITKTFSEQERYGLISQIRRASSSVGLNIVEGQARGTKKEFSRFLYIARGSNQEVNYLLLLAKDLGYLNDKQYQKLSENNSEVNMMLNGLIKSLQ